MYTRLRKTIGALSLACSLSAAGDSVPVYSVETAAGSYFVGDGGTALDASMSQSEGIVRDPSGNLFISDADDHRIRKVTPDGLIETVAGDGQSGFSGDGGPARLARLNHPYGLALDRWGALYIADLGNARVRRIGPDGTIGTVAGGGSVTPGDGDGSPASLLSLTTPRNVAVDAGGNLYISDFDAHRIYRVDANGVFTTVAGMGESGNSGDGAAARDAQLSHPAGLAVDYTGTLYIADWGNGRVRRLIGRTLWSWSGILDSPPTGLAVDPAGNLFIGNGGGGMVMRVNTMGGVSALPVAGSALYAANGQLFLAGASQVGVFDLATQVRTDIAGLGSFHFSGDGGPATLARLHGPYALAAGNSGDFFVADLLNRRVRRIDAAGQITTVAGNGSTALFDEISGLAVDASGVLWIADRAAHCLWKLGASGQLTLAAGTGKPEFKGDNGPASSASLNAPHALAFDRNGNLFVADAGNGRVRKITPGGWISTVVAGLSEPRGLGFDAAGDLYIAETAAGRVERLTAKGALESVASGLRAPRGISIGSDGTVFVAAGGAGQVVALGAGGTPIPLAADAGFQAPMDVLVLPNGSLLVADFGTGLIRRLVPQTAPITLLPQLHILHAATNLEGAVAPGEIVSVYGSGFFGDCALLASATPAWLLYVGSTQINAVLPNELQPGEAATLQAVCGGTPVGEAAVTVAAANPGLFADNGRAAALNQDGTVNSSTYPATQGSIISLFGTGLGAAHAATVTIAGYDTAVLYAGPAPGLPGVFQVNARVPAVSGDAEVRVTAGGVPSPSGVTLAVR